MFSANDVRDAFFARMTELFAEADEVTPEAQAVYGVQVYDPETNELDRQATLREQQKVIARLRHGQAILESARLIIGNRQVVEAITLDSNDAPTVLVSAGWLATEEAFRQVTLVTDVSYMTPAEIARKTGTAESTWRNKAAAGEIPGATKKGKQWLLPKSILRSCGLDV